MKLYLSERVDMGDSGPRVRKRLSLLDVDRRSRGLQAWGDDPSIRLFFRGIYGTASLPSSKSYEPLYVEQVRALVDALDAPTFRQQRDVALVALSRATGLDAASLSRLTWANVRIRADDLRLEMTTTNGYGICHHLVASPTSALCPRAALSRWRQAQQQPIGPIFGGLHSVHVRRILNEFGTSTQDGLDEAVRAIAKSSLRRLRSRSAILLAFSAALSTQELQQLRRQDVVPAKEGLLIKVLEEGPSSHTACPGRAVLRRSRMDSIG